MYVYIYASNLVPHLQDYCSAAVASHVMGYANINNMNVALYVYITRLMPRSLVSSLKLEVSFAKEPYKRDYILQKRLIEASPYTSYYM